MWGKTVFSFYLILLSFFDIRDRKLPVKWLCVGTAGVLLQMAAALWTFDGEWELLCREWLTGISPGILLLTISCLTGRIGKGDGAVLILAGIMAEGRAGVAVFAWSLLLAFVYALFLLCWKRKGRDCAFPYIPFVAAAFWLQGLLDQMR